MVALSLGFLFTVLIDWLGKMQLIDEAEQILDKIIELGETPPFEVHISLCNMYSRAGTEKKALQVLGVVESKKEQLRRDEFVRIISSLSAGGFTKDAQRMLGFMEARGFVPSEELKVNVAKSDDFRGRKTTRYINTILKAKLHKKSIMMIRGADTSPV